MGIKLKEGETFYPFGIQTGQPEEITEQMFEWWTSKHPEDKHKFEIKEIKNNPKKNK